MSFSIIDRVVEASIREQGAMLPLIEDDSCCESNKMQTNKYTRHLKSLHKDESLYHTSIEKSRSHKFDSDHTKSPLSMSSIDDNKRIESNVKESPPKILIREDTAEEIEIALERQNNNVISDIYNCESKSNMCDGYDDMNSNKVDRLCSIQTQIRDRTNSMKVNCSLPSDSTCRLDNDLRSVGRSEMEGLGGEDADLIETRLENIRDASAYSSVQEESESDTSKSEDDYSEDFDEGDDTNNFSDNVGMGEKCQ